MEKERKNPLLLTTPPLDLKEYIYVPNGMENGMLKGSENRLIK